MNFISSLNSQFLKSLFPNGLEEPVLIGQLALDLSDQLTMHIHVTQKPAVEVNKWGVWGKDYNIIVIKVIGQFLNKTVITNWENVDFCFLDFTQGNEFLCLKFCGESWCVDIEVKALTFQNCNVYIK